MFKSLFLGVALSLAGVSAALAGDVYTGAQVSYVQGNVSVLDFTVTEPDGVNFTGVVGYGDTVADVFGYSVEVFGGRSTVDVADVSVTWNGGVDARLGLKFDPVFVYGLVGYEYARFTSNGGNEWQEGIRYGAGVQFDVSKPVAVRLGWVHTDFNDFGPVGFTTDEAVVGVAYRF